MGYFDSERQQQAQAERIKQLIAEVPTDNAAPLEDLQAAVCDGSKMVDQLREFDQSYIKAGIRLLFSSDMAEFLISHLIFSSMAGQTFGHVVFEQNVIVTIYMNEAQSLGGYNLIVTKADQVVQLDTTACCLDEPLFFAVHNLSKE